MHDLADLAPDKFGGRLVGFHVEEEVVERGHEGQAAGLPVPVEDPVSFGFVGFQRGRRC